MHDTLWYHLIANCLSSTRFVDEYKRIYTVILLISKAIRRTHQGKGRRHGRMARRELSNFVGLGASGELAASASSKSRKSSPVATGKNLRELITMSVSLPPGRWNLMAMPCGLAALPPSGTLGIPLESEKRTVTGIVAPLNNTARLSPADSGDALKLPSTTMPLA